MRVVITANEQILIENPRKEKQDEDGRNF